MKHTTQINYEFSSSSTRIDNKFVIVSEQMFHITCVVETLSKSENTYTNTCETKHVKHAQIKILTYLLYSRRNDISIS